jgi:hypothetical protein
MYENGLSAASELNNEQLQVLITGRFGDGSLVANSRAKNYPNNNCNFLYRTSCIHKEYLEYKKYLLGDLCKSEIVTKINGGYKRAPINILTTISDARITKIALTNLQDLLYKMDELGLALWFYDDGSRHKRCDFYNLNTQSFSEEFNEEVIAPFLKDKFDIKVVPTIERKKDGREFWYLRVCKFDGAFIISDILRKYYVECFDYKLISSETSLKWRKLQEKLKSTDIETLNRHSLSVMLNNVSI